MEVVDAIFTLFRVEPKKLAERGVDVYVVSEEIYWRDAPALWIAIDGTSLVEVYNAVEAVIHSIQEAVQKVGNQDTTELILDRYSIPSPK